MPCCVSCLSRLLRRNANESSNHAILGAACALVWTATAALAGVVSNREGDCWHVGARPIVLRLRFEFIPVIGGGPSAITKGTDGASTKGAVTGAMVSGSSFSARRLLAWRQPLLLLSAVRMKTVYFG
jgi:hypothetical protein